jgi:hypothetical protein
VWRSFAEASVVAAIQSEKLKRLEAELKVRDLEEVASKTIFSASENAEYSLIWSRLNRLIPITARVTSKRKVASSPEAPTEAVSELPRDLSFVLDMGAVFRGPVSEMKYQFHSSSLHDTVSKDVLFHLKLDPSDAQVGIDFPVDLDVEMLRYGFVERKAIPPSNDRGTFVAFRHREFRLVLTPKFDRFTFWLEHELGPRDPLSTVVTPAK